MEAPPLPAILAGLKRRVEAAVGGADIGSLYEEVLSRAIEAAESLSRACETLDCGGVPERLALEAEGLGEQAIGDPYGAYDRVKEFANRLVACAARLQAYRSAYLALAGGGAFSVAASALAAAVGAPGPLRLLALLAGSMLALAAALLASYRASPALTLAGAAVAALGNPPLLEAILIAAGVALAVASLLYRRPPGLSGCLSPSTPS
ncbi:MAG: hypothetical protein GSR80_001146 [Desulfurococcales archaeon]|nr:hypothetical protein [Desulfurococcales archaeon]